MEIHTRWEYPLFDLDNFEHRVFYAGPSIHYSQETLVGHTDLELSGLRQGRRRASRWANLCRGNATIVSAKSRIQFLECDEIRIRLRRAADLGFGRAVRVCRSISERRASAEGNFSGKSFTAAPVKLTRRQRKAIEQASGVRVLRDEQQVWRVSGGGWFIVDEVVGKHEFITYAVGLERGWIGQAD